MADRRRDRPGDDASAVALAKARALADMARMLLAQETVAATLDRIARSAIELIEGCTDAGILVVRGGQVYTLAASSDLVRASDALQGKLREGPCFDVEREHRQMLSITDMSGADTVHWPKFAEGARALGIGSMIGFRLFTDEQDLGALNLYSRTRGALDEDAENIGWLLASHSAVVLAASRTEENLHVAIATRQRIGQAVGILMERHRLTDDQAFELLARTSQNLNRKVRDVAEHLVTTGELP
ncbi:GAF and ANTAR domain-containing protein [Spirillospora sp. NPDC047279]|uniref:GAF and ANTAR domain-containing protein n=1 Tax=Spirillospora sp. NPDC047279 TaxID=3155478 RepID=UPI0033E0A5CE